MWLFTQDGFYSAVAHRDDPDLIVVRARSFEDLRVLARKHGLACEVVTVANSDYPCRFIMHRGTWAEVCRAEANDIRYGNFKSRVAQTIGQQREHVYHRVWYDMLEVEKENPPAAPVKPKKAKRKPRSGKGKARAT